MLVALLFVLASAEPSPLLEIHDSVGALEPEGPRGARLRVRVDLINHLPISIVAPEMEVELDPANPTLPSWRKRESFPDVSIGPDDSTSVLFDSNEPSLSTVRGADVRYLTRVVRYRVPDANLTLLAQLIRDGEEGDQRAALSSLAEEPRDERLHEIRMILTRPVHPNPSLDDALVLLLAIRAAGEIPNAPPTLIGALVALARPELSHLWRDSIVELASRIIDAHPSGQTAPRLALLPAWARRNDPAPAAALDDAIVAALVERSDSVVPDLVALAKRANTSEERGLAARTLHTLGRSTPRSQLDLPDRSARIRWVEILIEIQDPSYVPVLAELATGPDPELKALALRALTALGPSVVGALFDALDTHRKESRAAILSVVADIGPAVRKPLEAAAERFGVPLPKHAQTATIATLIADHLERASLAHSEAELLRGLELLRLGAFDDAVRILDAVWSRDKELYATKASEIARGYAERADTLIQNGNYDVALQILETARTIKDTPEIQALTRRARVSLLEGLLSLDDLSRAEELISQLSGDKSPEIRLLEAKVFAKRAEMALLAGETSQARNLLNRARAIAPDLPEVGRLHGQISLTENTALLGVLAVLSPVLALLLILTVIDRARKSARSKAS